MYTSEVLCYVVSFNHNLSQLLFYADLFDSLSLVMCVVKVSALMRIY